MKNTQVAAANREVNRYRSTIKLDVTENDDGSETLTPYLIADPARRGTPVTISPETSEADVTKLFKASLRSVLQGA